jgi:hypothetical protein
MDPDPIHPGLRRRIDELTELRQAASVAQTDIGYDEDRPARADGTITKN